jgi:hypothetical protein
MLAVVKLVLLPRTVRLVQVHGYQMSCLLTARSRACCGAHPRTKLQTPLPETAHKYLQILVVEMTLWLISRASSAVPTYCRLHRSNGRPETQGLGTDRARPYVDLH